MYLCTYLLFTRLAVFRAFSCLCAKVTLLVGGVPGLSYHTISKDPAETILYDSAVLCIYHHIFIKNYLLGLFYEP